MVVSTPNRTGRWGVELPGDPPQTELVLPGNLAVLPQSSCVAAAEDEEARWASRAKAILEQLERSAVPRCPSCDVAFDIDPNRGCDAVWCSNDACRRAFCLWCLSDCGDDCKTDVTARNPRLIGDAHAHVRNNDCGLTGGNLFSGEKVVKHHADAFAKRVSVRLRRCDERLQSAVLERLGLPLSFIKDRDDSDRQRGEGRWPWDPDIHSFHQACWEGRVEEVQCRLDLGQDVDATDITPPHMTGGLFAANQGHVAVLSLLMQRRVSPYSADAMGRTMLHHICNCNGAGNVSAVRLLVSAGLQVPFKQGRLPWSVHMHGGGTPIELARVNRHDSALHFLTSMKSYAPKLLAAVSKGVLRKVNELLCSTDESEAGDPLPEDLAWDESEAGDPLPEDLVHVRDKTGGATPLHFACSFGGRHSSPDPAAAAMQIVRTLLRHRADANVRDLLGLTPLHYLLRERTPSVAIADALVDSGADWRLTDTLGMAALDIRVAAQKKDSGHLMAYIRDLQAQESAEPPGPSGC